jgi:hypothetical protein
VNKIRNYIDSGCRGEILLKTGHCIVEIRQVHEINDFYFLLLVSAKTIVFCNLAKPIFIVIWSE